MKYFIFDLLLSVVLYCSVERNTSVCDPNVENIICEGGECTLNCEKDGHISIKHADYGRTKWFHCDISIFFNQCSSPIAMQNISQKCNNKVSCTVEASNDVFGDPCPGVQKYVSLEYSCSENPGIISSTVKPTTKVYRTTTDKVSSTSKFIISTVELTTLATNLSSDQKITGTVVGVVAAMLAIIFICLLEFIYRRFQLKRIKHERETYSTSFVNTHTRNKLDLTSTDNQAYGTDSEYHRYSEIASPQNITTCAEYSTCQPQNDCQNSNSGENVNQAKSGDDNVMSNYMNLKPNANINDGSYFVLDPKETGYDITNKLHASDYDVIDQEETGVDWSKETQLQSKSNSNVKEVNYELAEPLGNCHSQEDLTNETGEQHDGVEEYNYVQNFNQSECLGGDLYDRLTDNVYDTSTHIRIFTVDDTYAHSDLIKE